MRASRRWRLAARLNIVPFPIVIAPRNSRFLTGLGALFGMTRDFDGFLQTALVQKVLPVEGIALGGAEARVADDAA